jgi:hypothetical protein
LKPRDGLPPSLKLRRTAVALAEAGQAVPRAGLKTRPYRFLHRLFKARPRIMYHAVQQVAEKPKS